MIRCFQIYILLFCLVTSASTQETIAKRVHEATTLVYPPSRHAPLHKATAVHLFAFMALIGRTDVTPDDPQGLAATRLKSTDDPKNRNDDDDLTVYGVNSGQNNIIFNSSMQSIDIYEGKGPKQKLRKPRGIACNSYGDVYIADSGNNRIVKLFNPGSYLTFVDAFGKKGTKPGEFNEPRGIALGTEGRIFITDTGNDRIQVFDKNMGFLYALGDKNDSTGLAVSMVRPDGIAFADPTEYSLFFREEFMVVIDLNNTRIRKLTPDGRFIGGVNSTDYGYQQVFLTSVAVDFYSNIWVTDMFNHCVHKFDRHLNYITRFGNIGDGDNQFFEPRGIAIGRNYGQVFINDKKSAQYFHIGTDILDLNISLQDSSVRFDFLLTEHSKITARIFDEKDNPIGLLCLNKSFSIGKNSILWNRQLGQGMVGGIFPNELLKRRLADDSSSIMKQGAPKDSGTTAISSSKAQSGLYRIRIEAKTNYIYNRYFTKQVEVEFAF
ncbi:NHL repeat-containing protein [bacterium]|nr:NHL repeat-containing protein [bacterium]